MYSTENPKPEKPCITTNYGTKSIVHTNTNLDILGTRRVELFLEAKRKRRRIRIRRRTLKH